MDTTFEVGPDVQCSRRGTDSEDGTELGLILCEELIEKHGGSLRIESDVGHDSIFTLTLPKKAGESLSE